VPEDAELQLRTRIMAALSERLKSTEGSLSRAELSDFPIGPTERRRLIDSSKGIWNPRDLTATLAIVSSHDGPYADEEVDGGLFRYDYRAGTLTGDNTKLRRAYELGLPLILLRKLEPGVFMPIYPVYVLHDDQEQRQFILALDESLRLLRDPLHPTADERRYAERVVKQRLHQPEFRARVLRAYGSRCAVCSLGRARLLDAAHIVSDTEVLGHAIVPNGLSLCKIHHAAYDANLLGVTPDLTVRINEELLRETDGPMLEHGLKDMHGRALSIPHRKADHPDRARLDARYQLFLAAG
jgi:putative restriction endonuclease